MPRYEPRATTPAGRVKSASVSSAFNQAPQISAEVYGTVEPSSLTLSQLKDGVGDGSETYPLTGDGSGGYDLQSAEYRGAASPEPDYGVKSGATGGLENVPNGVGATLDDFYASVTLSDPQPTQSTEQQARTALTAAGYSLVVLDGPGVWREKPGGVSAAFEETSTLSYLQSTLLKTGARYWIDGSTFYIDGSAAPVTFGLPAADLPILTAYSFQDESVTVDDPAPGTPPDREDYLSQCPDYVPPVGYVQPERTPETIRQGVFTYPSSAGTGDERVEYLRTNYYNNRLYKTQLIERGNVNTPSGVVFKERSRSVTTFDHHPMCREAIVKEVTTTYAAPNMNNAGSATEIEAAAATWTALGGNDMYLSSESVKEIVYHSSGYLKQETETIRELDVLSLRDTADGPVDFELVYNTRTRQVINEPNSGGRWVQYTNERQTENVVVYDKSEPDPVSRGITAEPARVQRNSRSTARAEESDGAPAQLSCSPPEPDDPNAPPDTAPCVDKQEYEYQKALTEYNTQEALKTAEYNSRTANPANQSKRVHSLTFGVLQLGLKLNALYGGGLVAGVSHQYGDSGKQITASTSITVWEV